jgi:hypothetical protein
LAGRDDAKATTFDSSDERLQSLLLPFAAFLALNRVTARVGFQEIQIHDVKSLGPKCSWLNDIIIDRMTDILASTIDTYHGRVESSKHLEAVFDSQFTMIHEMPNSLDRRLCRKFYHYRRLRGWSPRTINCTIFPNNVDGFHYNLLVVFPNQHLIVALHSLHGKSHEAARTIFRWLYDKTSYKHPEDMDTMFWPHLKDMVWVFRVDNEVSPQIGGYNCGVFLLGYVACILYGMSPRRLIPELIEGFRIRLFGDSCSLQLHTDPICIKGHPDSPWITETPSRPKLGPIPPTPLSPCAKVWSTATATQVVLLSNRSKMDFEHLKQRANLMRAARLAKEEEQKKKRKEEREETKRKREAANIERLRQIEKEVADIWKANSLPRAEFQRIDALNSVPIDELLPL